MTIEDSWLDNLKNGVGATVIWYACSKTKRRFNPADNVRYGLTFKFVAETWPAPWLCHKTVTKRGVSGTC